MSCSCPSTIPTASPAVLSIFLTSAGRIRSTALTSCPTASVSTFRCSTRFPTSRCGRSAGDNSVAEAGNNASPCWLDAGTNEEPFLRSPLRRATTPALDARPMASAYPGFFGPNGQFGGFIGGQCCASRANNLNPLSGPNGLEVSADGNFMFVGNGSSSLLIFDLVPMISSNYTTAPMLTAVIPTGTSPDYDGPTGITGCMASANGRAFSDPSCGDLRGDELATTGGVVTFPQDGSSRLSCCDHQWRPWFSLRLASLTSPGSSPEPELRRNNTASPTHSRPASLLRIRSVRAIAPAALQRLSRRITPRASSVRSTTTAQLRMTTPY